MTCIDVTLPTERYRIQIEPGLIDRLGEVVAAVAPHERAMLAVDYSIAAGHGRAARASLERLGVEVIVHELLADEHHKTLQSVQGMYEAMLAARLERRSPVIALGGGVVGDVAGFAAATFLRGVPLVQVPTTLLAMVDASIGGKTGVNHPRPADAEGRRELGKNLIGAFWQPRAVLIDPQVLGTLSPRDFRCGLAESVKHAVIGDASLLEFIDERADRIAARDEDVLVDLIRRSAAIKVGIVESDEREADRRMLLNLGHTFAHVIEPLDGLDLRHGEAVSIGLCASMFCAVATGRVGVNEARRVVDLLRGLGLPTRLPARADTARLIEAMGYDKKVAGGRLRLVLPVALGQAEVCEDVPHAAIGSAWRAVGGEARRGEG